MSVQVSYASTLTVVETIETNAPAISAVDNTITQNGFNTTAVLNAGSVQPATDDAFFNKALSSGAATIDLTALTGTNNRVVDGTGLKVQFAKFINPATNANQMTLTFGASNPYLLMGAAWKIILQPGQEFAFRGYDATPDVGSGAKNIDIAGTGSQALQVAIVVG